MSVATDMAAILSRGPRSAAYVFGAETGRGSFLEGEQLVQDDAGGAELVRARVFRVPIAKLAAAARQNSITIGGTAYVVRDVRITGGGEIREVYVG